MNACFNRAAGARRERGAALFISLIALVFMLLGGLALVRSVDTSNLIAGNLAFKQATVQASDAGVAGALSLLNGSIAGVSEEANFPAGCNAVAPTTCRYFALRQAEDAVGVPAAVGDWSGVPCFYNDSSLPAGCPAAGSALVATVPLGYSYQVVVERLCTGALPVTDIQGKCFTTQASGGGSKRAGAVGVFTSSNEVFYRANVRVSGPRNTRTQVQAILAR